MLTTILYSHALQSIVHGLVWIIIVALDLFLTLATLLNTYLLFNPKSKLGHLNRSSFKKKGFLLR